MYNWEKMNKEQQEDLLKLRKSQKLPWHSPPHRIGERSQFHITGACYKHSSITGKSPDRMSFFEDKLLEQVAISNDKIHVWAILPNHYHLLVHTLDFLQMLKRIFKLHQSTAYQWDKEDDAKGRKVWCNALETAIKSERHFWATVNYIHYNPVKHEYADKWTDWPYSSAKNYLKSVGWEKALENWKEYDISEMGKDWDL